VSSNYQIEQHNMGKHIFKYFKLFTTIKKRKIVKLSRRQVVKKANEHPSGAKQSWSEANMQHRRYHARRGYHSRYG